MFVSFGVCVTLLIVVAVIYLLVVLILMVEGKEC